jgi:uncharacterized protein (DUF58 family)
VSPAAAETTPGSRDELAAILDEVRRIRVMSGRTARGLLAGEYHSVFRGAGMEFDEVRAYVEGDDPRSIDWNVTARRGAPFVKKFKDEREQAVIFLLDLSASMQGGFGPWSARQVAARVCACLAISAVRNNDRVGFLAYGNRVVSFVPPRKGMGHALRIVRDCLVLPTTTGGTDPDPALDFVLRAVRRRAVAFLVSDFLSGAPGVALGRCARRHDVVAVRLLLPEAEPPAAGMFRVRDPETGRERILDANSAAVRDAWRSRMAAWSLRTERELDRAGVDRIDVPVPRRADRDAVAGPLLRFFRMRERRGARA